MNRIGPIFSRIGSVKIGMAGQLILIMVAAIILTQILSFEAYKRERGIAVRTSLGAAAIARTASLARALDGQPADLQAELLEAADTPLFRANLSNRSNVPAAHEEFGDLREMFVNATSQVSSNIRFTHADGKATRRSDWERIEAEAFAMVQATELGGMPRLRPRDLEHFCLSIELSSGQWLNVRASFLRPRLPSFGHFGVTTLIILFAITLPAIVLLRRIIKPMRALAAASDRFSRGLPTDPLPETGPPEARRTCVAFNRMQARISAMILDRTRTLAAISHDLRTPLTVMRLNAELLEDGPRKSKLIEQTDEVRAMCEAALDYARIDSAEDAPRTLDLSEIVQSVVDEFRDIGELVRTTGNVPVFIQGRPIGLKRCIRNLVENAVRYGGSAEISLREDDRTVSIVVSDNGPGMPDEQIEAMFEPFRRLEDSRNRATGGKGLGLSIARSIARLHGGDVHLHNRKFSGLDAVLTLPTKATTADLVAA